MFYLFIRLPQDLVDRCAALSVKTDAIQNLIDTMNNLADIHSEVEAMLQDTRKIIQVILTLLFSDCTSICAICFY